jgi:hypothetical protein
MELRSSTLLRKPVRLRDEIINVSFPEGAGPGLEASPILLYPEKPKEDWPLEDLDGRGKVQGKGPMVRACK